MDLNCDIVPVFVTTQECSLVVDRICHHFCAAGLQTVCTFDLTTTLPANGSRQCRVVVLLVYGKEGPPFSLAIFGEPGITTIKLQDKHIGRELAVNLLTGVLCGNV